jgi:hypothetical protein
MTSENASEPVSAADEKKAELEREIRKGRKFTLSEAIGRLAGPGMMKGVSPISRLQQAEVAIEEFLDRHLQDHGGALKTVLSRRAKGSELLLTNADQPLIVLASDIQRSLHSEYILTEIVREADIEWGNVLGERPYFDQEGCAPDPNDPYTLESVRTKLSQLLDTLAETEAK